MSRAGQVFSVFVVGILSVATAQYTLKPAFEQEQARRKAAEEQAAKEETAARELARLEIERPAGLKAAPVIIDSPKSSYLEWLKVWEWGKTSTKAKKTSDSSLPDVMTASEMPTLATSSSQPKKLPAVVPQAAANPPPVINKSLP